jgi:hypothetical protein
LSPLLGFSAAPLVWAQDDFDNEDNETQASEESLSEGDETDAAEFSDGVAADGGFDEEAAADELTEGEESEDAAAEFDDPGDLADESGSDADASKDDEFPATADSEEVASDLIEDADPEASDPESETRPVATAPPVDLAMQGQRLIQDGRFDEGFPYLQEAVERGEQTAEAMAQVVWVHAYNTAIRGDANLARGVEIIEKAKTLPVQDPVMRSQLDFWHGFAVFRQAAIAAEEQQSLPVAQRTLPMFQRALELFRAGQAYAQSPAGQPIQNNYQQYLTAAQEGIEIQQLIIRSGR